MDPVRMSRVIGGKRYSTETATLLAGNNYWDGHNYERRGRNTFLYRTPRGAYFALHRTMWQGEPDHIEPLTVAEAMRMYEAMATHDMAQVAIAEAFPGVAIEEA